MIPNSQPQHRLWLISILSLALFSTMGCGRTPSLRQAAKKQNESNAHADSREQLPALGRFEGQVLILSSKKKYDAVLESTFIYQVIPSPQDPAQTISIPKITGDLEFPILQRTMADKTYVIYWDLEGPMAFYRMIRFTSGQFDPDTHQLDLPYSIPEYPSGIWGELQGTLNGDVFSGDWLTKTSGLVGQFNLTRVSTASPPK